MPKVAYSTSRRACYLRVIGRSRGRFYSDATRLSVAALDFRLLLSGSARGVYGRAALCCFSMLNTRVLRYPGDGSARGLLKPQANDAALGDNFYSWACRRPLRASTLRTSTSVATAGLFPSGLQRPLIWRCIPVPTFCAPTRPSPRRAGFVVTLVTYYDLGKVVV